MNTRLISLTPVLLALLLASGLITIATSLIPHISKGKIEGGPELSSQPFQLRRWLVNQYESGPWVKVVWLSAWQIPAALIAAVIAIVITGWFPLGVASAAFIITGPALIRSSASQANFAQKTEGIAMWCEALRDTMQASRGIEAAIKITAQNAAKPIRDELTRMNRRISMGMGLSEALAECADEIANPVFDLISAVLLNGIAISPAQVPQLLDSIAEQAREQAYAHLQVHTSRAKQRSQLRLVGAIVLVSSIGFIVAFGTYLEPLSTTTGQMFLTLVAAAVAALLLWIVNLSTVQVHKRVIDPRRAINTQRSDVSRQIGVGVL